MKRRKFIQNITGLAGGISLAPTMLKASRKKRFRWRLVMVIPKTLPIWGEKVVEFSKNIKLMSGGGLDIRVYGASELVPALGVFDAVRSGQVQMGHSAAYYWQGKTPASPFFCTVPFGMDLHGMRSWILCGGGQELWDRLYSPFGIKPFMAGNTGMQMGGWFRKPINSVADFKGLKMRIPGLGGKVIAKLGGKPILVPGGEIFTNLTTGVIDATEWVGPYHDYKMGFHKAASHYYYPGWHEPGPVLELIINKQSWESLPKDYQEMIRISAQSLDLEIAAQWLAKDMEYLNIIKQEGKVQIKAFPEDVLKQAHSHAQKIKKEVAQSSPLAKEIYDSYSLFQVQQQAHTDVTLRPYLQNNG